MGERTPLTYPHQTGRSNRAKAAWCPETHAVSLSILRPTIAFGVRLLRTLPPTAWTTRRVGAHQAALSERARTRLNQSATACPVATAAPVCLARVIACAPRSCFHEPCSA